MPDQRDSTDLRADLILRALAVVDDGIYRCQYEGHLTGEEPALRFALAFLFAIAREQAAIVLPPRQAFDELWRAVTGRPCQVPPTRDTFRSTWARTQVAMIEHRLGVSCHVDGKRTVKRPSPAELRRFEAIVPPPR